MAVPFPAPGTTILVVDDERITRRVAYRILSEQGYRVFEAASADEAMSVLDMAHRYVHLILLDVVMPVVDGVSLGREILAHWPALKLLYMSAYPAEVTNDFCAESCTAPLPVDVARLTGAQKWLRDPFSLKARVDK